MTVLLLVFKLSNKKKLTLGGGSLLSSHDASEPFIL
jgi:hypothetical protein